MAERINIRKVLAFAGWMALGAGVLVLLVAAVQTRSAKACAGINIEVNEGREHLYTDERVIDRVIRENAGGDLTGKAVKDLDLRKMEEAVERDPWVRNAEIFLDNDRLLQVHIEEAAPIARIFTVHGDSYYIDSSLRSLPLNDLFSPRLPVFTGFPQEKGDWRGKDSLLMVDIKHLAMFIGGDAFWMAQVDQMDINAQNTFEILPKVGDHIVFFGDGSDIEGKFHRLRLFYEQVLSRKGWSIYDKVDVQYRGQVVATHKDLRTPLADTARSIPAPVKDPRSDPPARPLKTSSSATPLKTPVKTGAAGAGPAVGEKKTPKAVMPAKPVKTEQQQRP